MAGGPKSCPRMVECLVHQGAQLDVRLPGIPEVGLTRGSDLVARETNW